MQSLCQLQSSGWNTRVSRLIEAKVEEKHIQTTKIVYYSRLNSARVERGSRLGAITSAWTLALVDSVIVNLSNFTAKINHLDISCLSRAGSKRFLHPQTFSVRLATRSLYHSFAVVGTTEPRYTWKCRKIPSSYHRRHESLFSLAT